jgi:hypothetical protein
MSAKHEVCCAGTVQVAEIVSASRHEKGRNRPCKNRFRLNDELLLMRTASRGKRFLKTEKRPGNAQS